MRHKSAVFSTRSSPVTLLHAATLFSSIFSHFQVSSLSTSPVYVILFNLIYFSVDFPPACMLHSSPLDTQPSVLCAWIYRFVTTLPARCLHVCLLSGYLQDHATSYTCCPCFMVLCQFFPAFRSYPWRFCSSCGRRCTIGSVGCHQCLYWWFLQLFL